MTVLFDEIDIPDFDTARFEEGNFGGVIEILDRNGDTKILWDADNELEVEVAKAAFKAARKRGMLAYRVNPEDSSQGEVMTEFDPAAGRMTTAERVIVTPALRGG